MNDSFRLSMWNMTCKSTESHALMMGRDCSQTAMEMIAAVAKRFCDQKPPTTSEELSARHLQSISVSSLFGSIVHADRMARGCPKGAEEMFSEVRRLSERPPPRNGKESTALSSELILVSGKISSIYHKYAMGR